MREREGDSGPGRMKENSSVEGEPRKGRQVGDELRGSGGRKAKQSKAGGARGALERRRPLCLFVICFLNQGWPRLSPLLGGPAQMLNQAVMGGPA